MNLKPRFCIDVTRLTDDEEHKENNYKNILLSSLDKEVCVIKFSHFHILSLLFLQCIRNKMARSFTILYNGYQDG